MNELIGVGKVAHRSSIITNMFTHVIVSLDSVPESAPIVTLIHLRSLDARVYTI